MAGDPEFAYNVIRPVAVVAGYLISMRLGWMARDWWIKREERRTLRARNVTPSRV